MSVMRVVVVDEVAVEVDVVLVDPPEVGEAVGVEGVHEHDARPRRGNLGEPLQLVELDGRAGPELPRARGRVGAAVPAGVLAVRLASQRRLLEGRAVVRRRIALYFS